MGTCTGSCGTDHSMKLYDTYKMYNWYCKDKTNK